MKSRDRFDSLGIVCRLDGAVVPVGNVSVGGLFLATDLALFSGQLVELELSWPDRPAFRVLARVTWENDPALPRARELPHGFGVQITRIGLAEKLALVDLLKRTAADE